MNKVLALLVAGSVVSGIAAYAAVAKPTTGMAKPTGGSVKPAVVVGAR